MAAKFYVQDQEGGAMDLRCRDAEHAASMYARIQAQDGNWSAGMIEPVRVTDESGRQSFYEVAVEVVRDFDIETAPCDGDGLTFEPLPPADGAKEGA